jgi:transcriptional regulator GlxA family with amidase domain
LPTASDLEAGEQLAEVFGELLGRYGAARTPDRPTPGIAAGIQRLLAEDLTRTPSLDELAGFARLPRFQLLRAFQSETGTTPHRYLRQLRLRNAQQLLTAGYSVARAAAESGFHDQAHLHRHFRRTFAATPGTFSRNGVQDQG